ncbi:MAG: restriction endonuclease [Thiotrichaceae bacterium]
MALWLVRAGSRGEREDFALENNCVVVGWEELSDLTDVIDRDALSDIISESYPSAGTGRVKNWLSQLWAFRSRIKVGDRVVLPLKTRSSIAIGKITGDYGFSTENGHHRSVKWIEKDLPRSRFDQDILYSFGAFMTVCQIKRNNAEQRVLAVLEGKPSTLITAETDTDLNYSENNIADSLPDLEQIARDQIRNLIGRKFRGHMFSRLVAEILKAQGFQVKESPPGADGGIDIIAGKGSMGFDTPRLAVQVKSSDSALDVTVLRELQGVMRNFRADQGLIVSWGGYKTTTLKEATKVFFEVRLWDSDDVVRFIQEHYDSLSDSIQAELPLKPVWILVSDEIGAIH